MCPGAPSGYHLERAESEGLGRRGNVPKGGRLEELGTWEGKCRHMDLMAGSGHRGKGSIVVWGREEGMMGIFMYQTDRTMGCPGIWPNVSLSLSVRVFLDEINI